MTTAGEITAEGPPRLVLRFTLVTAAALAVAAFLILLVVRHFLVAQAERGAALQARTMADSLLRSDLRSSDFTAPVTSRRRAELDRLFRRQVLIDDIVLVALYAPDGRITYATDASLIGATSTDPAHLREARSGTIRSDVSSTRSRRSPDERIKVLRTYVPVPFATSRAPGVAAVYQDYGPIAGAARSAFLPIAGVFEAALLLLYLGLTPVLRRVTRRIKAQMQEIAYRAYYDELTDLPNRSLFRDRLGQALLAAERERQPAGILLIDLDRFKEINDALGHQYGDAVLRDLSTRLRGTLRAGETLARIGGDEFTILLPKASPAIARQVADRVHAVLQEPFHVRELSIQVDVSIGAALYPTHGSDVETVLQRADVAMYAAKEARSGFALYHHESDPNDPSKLAMVGELRRGLDRGELVPYFQPRADLRTGEIVGAEALVRWQHPTRGLLPPSEFLPLAERTGLMRPLGRWMLEAALEQCREWVGQGLDLSVSVNLAMPDLLDLTLPDQIAKLLRDKELEPRRLQLEITESMILADPFRVRHVLTRLREMDVRVAIDDFGTGYSSLGYLKHLPVDEIKIDKSFVLAMADDESDATIVRSTIDLGRNLGLDVVAEGVETAAAWEALRRAACDFAQGNHIGCAMPAAELTALLRSSKRHTAVHDGRPRRAVGKRREPAASVAAPAVSPVGAASVSSKIR